jgi:hypothetical protein
MKSRIEFPVGKQSAVAADLGAVEFPLDRPVEIDTQRLRACFTHWMLRIFGPAPAKTSSLTGSAQSASYHDSPLIREMGVEAVLP